MNKLIMFGPRSPASALRWVAGMGLVSAAGLMSPATSAASPLLADVSLNIGVDLAPPPPPREVVIERNRPGPDYVWIGGYWDGAPGHYVWRAGRWDHPPHPHAVWSPPRWDRDRDGHYHQVRGEWRDEERRR